MELTKKLEDFLQTFDSRDFYKYLGAMLILITLVISLLGWFYYSSTREYLKQIQEINSQREEKVKKLFESHERILLEEKQVNKLLDEDPNFKIIQYVNDTLQNLGLDTLYKVTRETSPVEREQYLEVKLPIPFASMNMQELCELLQELEKSKRIFTNDIDIQRSKKKPDTIDVTLEIATLRRKTGK